MNYYLLKNMRYSNFTWLLNVTLENAISPICIFTKKKKKWNKSKNSMIFKCLRFWLHFKCDCSEKKGRR